MIENILPKLWHLALCYACSVMLVWTAYITVAQFKTANFDQMYRLLDGWKAQKRSMVLGAALLGALALGMKLFHW